LTQELRDEARALGLENLTDEHLVQFDRARIGMDARARLSRGSQGRK
jgi:hypothetical protein